MDDSEKYPRWLVPLLFFVTGVLSAMAILMPLATSPDCAKCHADGFREGMAANKQMLEASVEEAFQAGKRIACP